MTTTTLQTVPVLTSLKAATTVERNLRHFGFALHLGETVMLQNLSEGITVLANVIDVGDYSCTTKFVIK